MFAFKIDNAWNDVTPLLSLVAQNDDFPVWRLEDYRASTTRRTDQPLQPGDLLNQALAAKSKLSTVNRATGAAGPGAERLTSNGQSFGW